MVAEIAPQAGYDPGDIEIRVTGSRPGEKLYEELMNTEEVRRSVDIGDFLMVRPALASKYRFVNYDVEGAIPVDRPYNSEYETALTRDELRDYLLKNGLLDLAD